MRSFERGLAAWLALYSIEGLGNRAFQDLLRHFGSPQGVFEASPEALTAAGVKPELAARIARREITLDPEAEMARLAALGGRAVTFADPDYPSLLREIPSPPMVLFLKGRPLADTGLRVAVVGSRNPTAYGLRAAALLARELARERVGIVSGLARGIDTAAHEAAIKVSGTTLAVLGTGLNIVYPRENARLFEAVAETGTVVSEFPLDTPPEPRHFPIRNRIISGLSHGVLVVEAARHSGSLITAAMALQQGREVFAVPGSIESLRSRGTHLLIKQGAKLTENAADVLAELGAWAPAVGSGPEGGEEALPEGLSPAEADLYRLIGHYPRAADDIIRQAAVEAGEALSLLLQMELRGVIRQLPGRMFARAVAAGR